MGRLKQDGGSGTARCELIWPDKSNSMGQAQVPSGYVLLPCPEDSMDWACTRNLYIEGDNLEALKLLRGSYAGTVKLIYIDPPYNTGGGFIYHDDFGHSEWLSMMAPRLVLARELLRDDGAIALSISENELFHLKLLCDEVFGEENYLTTFSVRVRHESRILKGDKDYHEVIEYLLLYRKSRTYTAPKRKTEDRLDEYVWRIEKLSAAAETVTMGAKTVQVFRPGQYRLVREQAGPQGLKRISIRGALKEGNSSGRFYMRYLDAYSGDKGLLFKVPDIGDDGLGFRYFLTPEKDRRRNGDYFQGVPQRRRAHAVPYANLLDFEREFNRVGTEGGVEFRNGKKPVAFLEKVLELTGMRETDGIVLDFFAGSATTAHAVMHTNARWGRNSRFIMVQIDEDLDETAHSASGETQAAARRAVGFLDSIGAPHKLSEIGKERLRIAGAECDGDVGFRVFRVEEPDGGEEVRFFATLLKSGLTLDVRYEIITVGGTKVFVAEEGALAACFAKTVPEDTLIALASLGVKRYVLQQGSRTESGADAVAWLAQLLPNTPILVI